MSTDNSDDNLAERDRRIIILDEGKWDEGGEEAARKEIFAHAYYVYSHLLCRRPE